MTHNVNIRRYGTDRHNDYYRVSRMYARVNIKKNVSMTAAVPARWNPYINVVWIMYAGACHKANHFIKLNNLRYSKISSPIIRKGSPPKELWHNVSMWHSRVSIVAASL